MGVKHPKKHAEFPPNKTNHQTGYHKPQVNPTTNFAKDTHKKFCERCISSHEGICPETETERKSFACNL